MTDTDIIKIEDISRVRSAGELAAIALTDFLDLSATASGRATFHNDRAALEQAVAEVHRKLMLLDRGVYALAAAIVGATDYTKQMVILRLLASPAAAAQGVLSAEDEYRVLEFLLNELPPQRVFKLFEQIKSARVNNARTRRLLMRFMLNAKQLPFWAVKYRRKMCASLRHALGRRKASIVQAVLLKAAEDRDGKEAAMLESFVMRYVAGSKEADAILEALSFALGNSGYNGAGFRHRLLSARVAARHDWSKAALLPYEVAEGIRSKFHAHRVSSKDTLRRTAANAGRTQSKVLQRKAEIEGVRLQFDPRRYDAVELYLYAFERGMSEEIELTLQQKARSSARTLSLTEGRIAIVLDASQSMFGHRTQALRPMATALAIRDCLRACASARVVLCGGRVGEHPLLVRPAQHTALAESVLDALDDEPEAIFIISDGYENSPAGRVDEVIAAVQNKLHWRVAFYHINPVAAQEAAGVRQLSPRMTPWPVHSVQGLGLALTKMQLLRYFERGDCEQGIRLLADSLNKRMAA